MSFGRPSGARAEELRVQIIDALLGFLIRPSLSCLVHDRASTVSLSTLRRDLRVLGVDAQALDQTVLLEEEQSEAEARSESSGSEYSGFGLDYLT
ncbi:hypothetical protein Nepgr_023694 [Nepenthes gracilis]|uniref:Uncharacterized protein n=1 Tax=Nepenthes gracilis TaxID=150966 RepID=A0AAD3T3A8_NEPGR|nr:hypothetical protein Nepgr_023694 [Nepenthes gracilis]